MKLLRIFLICLLSVCPALAETKIHLVHVQGQYALSRRELRSVVGLTQSKFNELRLGVRIARISSIRRDLSPLDTRCLTFDCQRNRLKFWRSEVSRRGWLRGANAVHIVLPPILEGGVRWFGGIAEGVCTVRSSRAISISYASYVNSLGYPRDVHSAFTILHEVGHTLGATHDSPPSVMDHSVLRYASMATEWGKKSKAQIRACLWPRR